MKTIGLIGGMSWESTIEYYRIINETVRELEGGFHSGKMILYSVDFAEIEKAQHEGRWNDTAELLSDVARKLEGAGADFLVLSTNTMHKVAGIIEKATKLKLLHIADVTGKEITQRGLKTIGLLGTRFTMEEDFYKTRLRALFGLDVVVPDSADMDIVDSIIYNELCNGVIKESSKDAYVEIIGKLVSQGAQGVILGCTEIPLLVKQQDVSVPLFDTTTLHARAAVIAALSA